MVEAGGLADSFLALQLVKLVFDEGDPGGVAGLLGGVADGGVRGGLALADLDVTPGVGVAHVLALVRLVLDLLEAQAVLEARACLLEADRGEDGARDRAERLGDGEGELAGAPGVDGADGVDGDVVLGDRADWLQPAK